MTMDLPAVEVQFIGEPKVFIQFGKKQFMMSEKEIRWDGEAFSILTVVK
jgi:hypothetical protein